MRGAQPSLGETSACMVFTVHAGHREDERQLAHVGQSVDIAVVEAGRDPHLHVAVTAIADDAHTAVHRRGDHGRRRVAGSVQTALAAFEKFVAGRVGIILQLVVNVADMLVVVLVVVARTLAGGDA